MTSLTTVKVTVETRDELKALAERDGVTLEGALRSLLRADRQRRMGEELAERSSDATDDRAWIASSNAAVSRALG
jgi:hypothetical protein